MERGKPSEEEMAEFNLRSSLLKEKQPQLLDKLAENLGVGVDVLTAHIDTLMSEGYGVRQEDGRLIRSTVPREGEIFNLSARFDPNNLHFGIVSDTHLGSKKERLDALEKMYNIFDDEGVTTVFHVGDITEGIGVYRGQENEVKHWSQTEQVEHAIRHYPKVEGINTYFITGNHDLKAFERGGIDPGVPITQARQDLNYLGQMFAEVELPGGTKLELLHPAGSQAYALSYKSQRDINARPPDQLPNMLVYGHYHTSFFMNYRGLTFVQAPSFKDQGQFEKRLGLSGNIGGWLVDAKVGDHGNLERIKPELFTFGKKGK